jgi:hypothetical protein
VEFQVVALWVLDADAVENAKIYATRLDFWPLIVGRVLSCPILSS